MYIRLLKPPARSFFLFGARGTGKTTYLKARFENAHFVDLLNEAKYQSYLADIDLFRREITARPSSQVVVVDEVQRLPELLNYVHQLIESERRVFVLTGSSARKLKGRGVNLLAGRAMMKNLFPLLPTEMGSDFDLNQALRIGTLPVVIASESPEETLGTYALTYLSQEIKAEAVVRNLQGFSRFLAVAAVFHGQTINISNIARESEISRTTVGGFFEILEDTLIGSYLPAFESRPGAREVRHPKFYFLDSGVVRAIKKQSGPVDSDEKGFLFEGFIHHCLKAYDSYLGLYDELTYWSPLDSKSLEVDFVLRHGKELTAIEVKAKTRLKPEDVKGLKAIASLGRVKRRFLIYLGQERQNLGDGILALPDREFYEMLGSGKLARS